LNTQRIYFEGTQCFIDCAAGLYEMPELIDKWRLPAFPAFDQLSPTGRHTLFFDFSHRPFFDV